MLSPPPNCLFSIVISSRWFTLRLVSVACDQEFLVAFCAKPVASDVSTDGFSAEMRLEMQAALAIVEPPGLNATDSEIDSITVSVKESSNIESTTLVREFRKFGVGCTFLHAASARVHEATRFRGTSVVGV